MYRSNLNGYDRMLDEYRYRLAHRFFLNIEPFGNSDFFRRERRLFETNQPEGAKKGMSIFCSSRKVVFPFNPSATSSVHRMCCRFFVYCKPLYVLRTVIFLRVPSASIQCRIANRLVAIDLSSASGHRSFVVPLSFVQNVTNERH